MRAPWERIRAIASLELRSYLRSPGVWISLALVLGFAVWTSNLATSRSLEPFLASLQFVPVLIVAYVTVLWISAGMSREEREAFDDVWGSLPARSFEQFWGKTLGALGPVLLFAAGLLALIPVGWFAVGTVWTPATTTVVGAYVAQTVGVLLYALGVAAFLSAAVANLRLRYVLGLLAVVGLVALGMWMGIDHHVFWANLFAPYMLVDPPYSQSLLFGVWPWSEAVMWHIAFQVALGLIMILAGRLIYRRRRDPQGGSWWSRVAFLGLVVAAIGSAGMYVRFWDEMQATLAAQVEYDAVPIPQVTWTPNGDLVRISHIRRVEALGYDLAVTMRSDGELHIRAELALAGDPDEAVWPLTLHHQWEVIGVEGEGVRSWSREGNLLRLELQPGAASHQVMVEYRGRPYLWDNDRGVINPMHFMGEAGGYLSPYLAWYPLAGERRLVTLVYHPTLAQELREEPGVGDRFTTDLEMGALVSVPVPFRVLWEGPPQLTVVSSLPEVAAERSGGRYRAEFAGVSDGVALLVGPLAPIASGEWRAWGAASAVHGAEALVGPYQMLIDFYEMLLDRRLPRRPLVAIPDWLSRYYSGYSFPVAVSIRGRPGVMRTTAHLGTTLVMTEAELAAAVGAAERWSETQSPDELFDATASLHDALLQSIWGRPYDHRPISGRYFMPTFLQEEETLGVAQGLTEYSLLRWAEFVLGPEFDSALREAAKDGSSASRWWENGRVAQQVLTALIELEETAGEEAVQTVLGRAFDHLATHPLTLADFEALIVAVVEGGVGQ